MRLFVTFLALLCAVRADIYLHSPRGSNNRLDEANRNRNNANRLFDSQNNNRGGYNVGSTYYYEGSVVHFEWTNQHSCGDENAACNLVLQYSCDSSIRDGSSRRTIPQNAAQCQDYNCETDLKYGMHENVMYYENCRTRARNQGLFIADRNLNRGTNARYTRQNNNGARYGYECPEERDYYPYWSPTPWKDIVVMTSNASRCPYYQAESQNVKSRFACVVPEPYFQYQRRCVGNRGYVIPVTKEECEKISWNYARDITTKRRPRPRSRCVAALVAADDPTRVDTSLILNATWVEYPSHGIPAPDCVEAPWSRDNHLGNGIGGFPNTYNWTMPGLNHEFCVFRMRYNISTSDYDAWAPNSSWTTRRNGQNILSTNVPIYEQVGLDETTAYARGYEFRQNPVVDVFGTENLPLRLAINTNQFGRTFEDRSHTFASRPRPADLAPGAIHNIQVRGKRGNIVQNYPGVEYDFVPNRLHVGLGEYVHFQWTGSNTNPNNNAGQGRRGTDRHNVVMLADPQYPERPEQNPLAPEIVYGKWGRSYPQHLDNATLLGFSREDMEVLAFLTNSQFRGEMSELDDAGTYFDLTPKKVTQIGTYHYMCTRNNNFSNRSQKGKIVVGMASIMNKVIGINGGMVRIMNSNSSVMIPPGAFSSPLDIQLEEWPQTDCQQLLENMGSSIFGQGETVSNCLVVNPQDNLAQSGMAMEITMDLSKNDAASNIRVYQTTTSSASAWTEVTVVNAENNMVTFESQGGGLFVAKEDPDLVLIGSVVAACIVVVIILIGTVVYFKRFPGKISRIRHNVGHSYTYVKRSLQSKV